MIVSIKKTGLITAVFEETFIPYLGCAMEYAAVDTNVEVYVGLIYTAQLAEKLDKLADTEELQKKAENLKSAINTYLWNEKKDAYYPYDVRNGEHIDCLMASTFFPLRMNIAAEEQKKKRLDAYQRNGGSRLFGLRREETCVA